MRARRLAGESETRPTVLSIWRDDRCDSACENIGIGRCTAARYRPRRGFSKGGVWISRTVSRPTDNGRIKSFNARLRDACSNVNQFTSVDHANAVIEARRIDDNEHRPHGVLGNLTSPEYAASVQSTKASVVAQLHFCPVRYRVRHHALCRISGQRQRCLWVPQMSYLQWLMVVRSKS